MVPVCVSLKKMELICSYGDPDLLKVVAVKEMLEVKDPTLRVAMMKDLALDLPTGRRFTSANQICW